MFKKIFVPGEFLMNKLSYVQKFLLIAVITGALVIFGAYLLVNEINEEIKVAEDQLIGAQYNNQLKSLLRNTQIHRGLSSSYLTGNMAAREQLEKMQETNNQVLNMISEERSLYQTVVADEYYWGRISKQWQDIKQALYTYTPAESFAEHTIMTSDILELIEVVGEKSGLMLGAGAGRYFLVNALVDTLPVLTEYMGQMRAKGAAAINQGRLTEAERQELLMLWHAAQTRVDYLQHELQIVKQGNKELAAQLNPFLDAAVTATARYLEVIETSIIKADTIDLSTEEYFATSTATIDLWFDTYAFISNYVKEHFAENLRLHKQYKNILTVSVAGVLTILFYFFIAFYLVVMKAINTLHTTAKVVAQGDLTVRVQLDTSDELSQVAGAFNEMTDSLAGLIATSKETASGANKLSEELASSVEATSSSIDQVAASASEFAGTSQELSNNAQEMATLSEEVSDKAKEGELGSQKVTRQMQEISNAVEGMRSDVETLGKRSEEIGKIVGMITDVAAQTNLLALNAAIEAARAGEHGRGFSVVAEEVRKLAEETTQAAEDIATLVQITQQETKETVGNMAKAVEEVRAGSEIVVVSSKSFQEISGSVEQIVNRIEGVSAATEEISAGSQEVAASAEEQSASMEEINAMAMELRSSMETLMQAVQQFKSE